MPVEIQPAPADIWPQLRLALMRRSPNWLPPACWDWRYRHADQLVTSWVILDGDRIRAHAGVLLLPVPGGRRIALLRDVWINPVSRTGLPGRASLWDVQLAVCKTACRGADLIVLPGDSRWAEAQTALRWEAGVCRSNWMVLDLAAVPVAGQRALSYRRSMFSEEMAAQCQTPRKTATYLNWRYDARYGHNYALYEARAVDRATSLGYMVLMSVEPQRELVVEARLPEDEMQAADFLAQVACARRQEGMRHWVVHAPQTGLTIPWRRLTWPWQIVPGTVHQVFRPSRPDLPSMSWLAQLSLGDMS